jgi:hypothetical protein
MAIPEFTRCITIRIPDDVRSQLESMSLKEDKPLSRVVRSVLAEGLKRRVATDDEFIELEA